MASAMPLIAALLRWKPSFGHGDLHRQKPAPYPERKAVTRISSDGHFLEVTGSGYSTRGEFLYEGKPVTISDYQAASHTLWVGVLNNDATLEIVPGDNGSMAYRMIGDPTEGSILVAAAKTGAAAPSILEAYPRKDEIPFDSSRKRMLTVHAVDLPDPRNFSSRKRTESRCTP